MCMDMRQDMNVLQIPEANLECEGVLREVVGLKKSTGLPLTYQTRFAFSIYATKLR